MKSEGILARTLLVSLLSVGMLGCRQDLFNQAKVKPYRESDFFADKQTNRPLVPGTIPRGFLREDKAYYQGIGPDGKFIKELPKPLTLTRALLDRGRDRFQIYCTPCHGQTGDGRGMIVRRGFKQPVSYHDPKNLNQPVGYFYDVMTQGFNTMSSYASQVPVEDRWAIAAYIRALQLSQRTAVAKLTEADQKGLERDTTPGATTPRTGGGEHGKPAPATGHGASSSGHGASE